MRSWKRAAAVLGAALGFALTGCAERDETDPAQAGHQLYRGICIACHHLDPTLDGPTGPAVACSSFELLEARIVRGEYPPGYVPKRPTRLMPAQPYLAERIPELAAYLASVCPE
ncbi:MAG: cytochrome c [Proteobacteria bacterium]|nr:cytochrome c [Pseudomonadota bacterium]